MTTSPDLDALKAEAQKVRPWEIRPDRDTIVIESLKAARDVAWGALVPAFDHAIVLAEEAAAMAAVASNAAQTYIAPAYPALVLKLAAA